MSLVDDVRKQVEKRLSELGPFVEEHEQLNALVQRLTGATSSTPQRRRGRPPGSKNRKGSTTTRKKASTAKSASATKRAARPKRASTSKTGARRGPGRPRGRRGGNTRAAQAQALVSSKPGITIPELAKEMGIKQNYLYRVMPGLAKERKVKRVGKGWHPVR
ncbi:MAG TPA: hypothetical protein VHE14_04240 [Solirubrobacteraceae bacterium]|nr:hypothetical protein [Solirubrobacteraceae bacterium]